jgi:hypothetical protein
MDTFQPPAQVTPIVDARVEPEEYAEQPESERGVYVMDLNAGELTVTKDGKTFQLRLADLPASGVAQFREVQFCDDGVSKTAYVLMTAPVAP